ncbi:MAG: helix-turn-helix transcriptional regulator [Eubacteriales bacterium]
MIQDNQDVMMAKRKISLNELAKRMDVSLANLSILKNNSARDSLFNAR